MEIKSYHSLSTDEKDKFFDFLKTIPLNDKSPSVKNMWDENWAEKINTLPYALEKTYRFSSQGCYLIAYENDKIIAGSGVYISDFSNRVGIAGSRTYVIKEYRHKRFIYTTFLPEHRRWCLEKKCDIMGLTFNEHNKNLIAAFSRTRLGESKVFNEVKNPNDIFYNGLNEVPFPVIIKRTQQWVIYEKFTDWDYNWSTIKA